MPTLRDIRLFLHYPSLTALSSDTKVFDRAQLLVRLFYSFLPFLAYVFFKTWVVPTPRENFSALWPLFWSSGLSLDVNMTIQIIRFSFVIVSILGLTMYRHRAVRLLVFIGVWQAHALASSFGSPVHDLYPWLFISLFFIFLPYAETARALPEKRRDYLLFVWSAQAYLMLLYSMAGFWKFHAALMQYLAGEINGFSLNAFAYQVADWVPRLQHEAALAPFIINHPAVAWPFYVASHCFQLLAFWAVLRPSLQKLWGVELVLFHIGTTMVMGIEFDFFIPLAIIMLLFSPFTPEKFVFRQVFFDLPVIGQVAEYVWRRYRSRSLA